MQRKMYIYIETWNRYDFYLLIDSINSQVRINVFNYS